ncbi:uncharacterized protein LOC110853244 isoform X2 [Folsomia candida]|uniref:uncharacterized protein LOC110853244 isoform X2 n=1 Tax=Folsomia candida TaxID=158441 RepID=UPI000B902386|nr:uncharacterized protein LOC110853244 isoform X2 [Folsomia candida]
MLGSKDDPGLIPRLCLNIWDKLEGNGGNKFRMEVSFMEIYREKVRDLLNPSGGVLKLREHPQFGPLVQDLRRLEVTEEHCLSDLLWEGECRRAIGTTGSNHRSSRSHAIWTIYLTRQKSDNCSTTITNRIHLVDLAGSEKAGFATAKNLLAEGADINRSLVALGNVISSLAEKAQYIPYRDSALTWLLKDSLGGNATTAIIITASPASCSHAQTLNSFRFAQRARLVENKPRINLNYLSPLLGLNNGIGIGLASSVASTSATPSAAALYSIMSAFEIKKDISKLSKIIRTAQSNGGILRSLTPRASWNRLVNALEGWNAIEGEQLKIQQEQEARSRAGSVDTAMGNSSPGKSDATSQANLIIKKAATCITPSSAPSSPTTKKTTVGNEVFIPVSNSIKCLTWRQEEVRLNPVKDPDVDEDCPKVVKKLTENQVNLLLPVQYPVPQHLDHPSRISEKIHRSLAALPVAEKARLGIVPDVLMEGNSPLIRHRIPTLVNAERILEPKVEHLVFQESENVIRVPVVRKDEDFFSLSDEESGDEVEKWVRKFVTVEDHKCVEVMEEAISDEEEEVEEIRTGSKFRLVRNKDKDKKLSPGTVQLPRFPSIFDKLRENKKVVTFEDISEGEEDDNISDDSLDKRTTSDDGLDEMEIIPVRRKRKSPPPPLREEIIGEDDNADEALICVEQFASCSPVDGRSWSNCDDSEDGSESSSSESGWNFLRVGTIPVLVKVMPEEGDAEKDFRLESITEWVKDVNANPIPVSTLELNLDLPSDPEIESEADSLTNNDLSPPLLDSGGNDSKFRTHFSRELSQMEQIGAKLAQLKQLSTQGNRFNVVKPYLDEIMTLETTDHATPDPSLDTHIEECSGWSVATELNLVKKEMTALSRLLNSRGQPRRDSNASSQSSRASSTTCSGTTQSQSFPSPRAARGGDEYHQFGLSSRIRPTSASERGQIMSAEFGRNPGRNSWSETALGNRFHTGAGFSGGEQFTFPEGAARQSDPFAGMNFEYGHRLREEVTPKTGSNSGQHHNQRPLGVVLPLDQFSSGESSVHRSYGRGDYRGGADFYSCDEAMIPQQSSFCSSDHIVPTSMSHSSQIFPGQRTPPEVFYHPTHPPYQNASPYQNFGPPQINMTNYNNTLQGYSSSSSQNYNNSIFPNRTRHF